jgi:(p)ppGpp synthase/HD superfamily hydrolase
MSTKIKSVLDVVREYAIECHAKINQKYDGYLPYEYHQRAVVGVAHRFKHLIPEEKFELVEMGCWVHDVPEDTGQTYNDVKAVCGTEVANISYALANNKGKNRKERADDRYYEGIRNEPFCDYIKFCDRIANIEYGVLTAWAGGRMLDMYRKENEHFCKELHNVKYNEMLNHIYQLLEKK